MLTLYEKLQLLTQASIAIYIFTIGILVYRTIKSIDASLKRLARTMEELEG